MTNEEAIDELEVIYERLSHPEDCEQGVYSFRDGDYLEALDMAIKALEQQPCEDCVSRQTSLRKGKWLEGYHYYPHFCSNCNYYTNDWDEMNFCPKCGSDMREE